MFGHHNRKVWQVIAVIVFGFGLQYASWAQTKPQIVALDSRTPSSAIYIGNSFFYFNNGIDGYVRNFVTAAIPGYKLRNSLVTISGSALDWHDVASYFRPNAIGTYSFDADNNIVFNKIDDHLFDVAIMMDCSQCPIHPELRSEFFTFAKKHAETVRKNRAVPIFFMSWAYQDRPEMTEQLAEAYTKAGNENNVLVIPAGLAFAKSIKKQPGLNLYVGDKRHPSVAGTYLAAATIFATVFGKSPVGSSYVAGLDAATAEHLQKVAWDTVREYFAR